MVFEVVRAIEDRARVKPSSWNRVFCIGLKQLLILILVIVVVLASFVWAYDRIETHKRWGSMLLISQRLGIVLSEARARLPSIMMNATTDPTHFWFTSVLDDAWWTLDQLIKIDEPHESELYRVIDLVTAMRGSEELQLTNSQFSNLSSTLKAIAQNFLDAYWNILNFTSVSTETGPPFWYFGPSPPDETLLQQIDDLAIQAQDIINSST